MNPLIEKNKNLLVTAAVVLVSLLAAKKANDINTNKCELLRMEIKNEEDKAAALERIVGMNEQLKKIQENSWDTTNFEVVVQRVSELSDAAAVKISSIMPSDKKTLDNYTAIPFSFVGETTYRNLEKFLKGLEKEKKLLRLKDITLMPISGSVDADQDMNLSLSLSGEALYYK